LHAAEHEKGEMFMWKNFVRAYCSAVVLAAVTIASLLRPTDATAGRLPEVSRVSPIEPRAIFQLLRENLAESAVHIWQPETGDDRPALGQPALPESPPQGASRLPNLLQHGRALCADGGRLRGAAVLWLENSSGFSTPRRVNRPEIWNRSAEQAMPWERFQIFGRNLRFQFTGRPWCVLRDVEDGSEYEAVWGPVQTQRMPHQETLKMEMMIPKDILPGKY
jgi:hypothetical protein